MSVNVWLRLLVFGLSFVLLLLSTYYFLVINRTAPSQQATASPKTIELEKKHADILLAGKVKSALNQSRRLYGYSLGVESKDGIITLSGEVPTQIDLELASNLAQETSGVKSVMNKIQLVPNVVPQAGSLPAKRDETSVNIEDLELQADLREQLLSVAELANQPIEIAVTRRTVTITGNVQTELQRAKAEALIQNFPKVLSVSNQLKLTEPPPATSTSNKTLAAEEMLLQKARNVLAANQKSFINAKTINISIANGQIILSGAAASPTERILAEKLVKSITGNTAVQNQLVLVQ